MSKVLSKLFKKKYDDYLVQMQYWEDRIKSNDIQISIIDKSRGHKTKPTHPDEQMGIIGNAFLSLFVGLLLAGLISAIFAIKGKFVLSVWGFCSVFVFVQCIIANYRYKYYGYPKEKAEYYNWVHQNEKKDEEINVLRNENKGFLSEYRRIIEKLRIFVIGINEWIHSNRKHIDVDATTLSNITRSVNRDIVDWNVEKSDLFVKHETRYNGHFVRTYSYSTGVLSLTTKLYKLFFETDYVAKPITTRKIASNSTQTRQNKKASVSIRDKYSAEIEKILAEHPWAKTKLQKEAAKELAGLNIMADIDEEDLSAEELEELKSTLHVQEEKNIVNHVSYEGRITQKEKKQMKDLLGYKCMACGKDMADIYGDIGQNYIELHHKKPYADIAPNETRTINQDDFCVLCPNCHAMIHKLNDAGNIELLSNIIKLTQDKK